MTTSHFGHRLNPGRSLRTPGGAKGHRRTVVITNNPSTIDSNQQLQVRFPNLESDDVIVPGTVRLSFTVALTSTDANRTVVQNLGRAIVRKLVVKISGQEVLSIDDADVFHTYCDLWRPTRQRANAVGQGIDLSANRNATKLRVGAGDGNAGVAEDAAINTAFGSRFHIELDFELLEQHLPFSASGFMDRLEYELTFNDYSRVVIATGDPSASYAIDGISLEFDVVRNPELARMIRVMYRGPMRIMYDRVLRHRKITLNKSDAVWNININSPMRSCRGILILFEDVAAQAAYARNTESFYNPKITKVEVVIEGVSNQLYSQGMRALDSWDEVRRMFAYGRRPLTEASALVMRDHHTSDVTVGEYFTTKYALWLDLRTTDDPSLHGSGRRIENASEGVVIQITKAVEAASQLNAYVYLVMDAQLILQDARLNSVLY